MGKAISFVLYHRGMGVMEYRLNLERPFIKQWIYPGGWIEKDETAEEALHREAMEELGITLKNYKRLGAISDPSYDLQLDVFMVLYWDYCNLPMTIPMTILDGTHNPVAWRYVSEFVSSKENPYTRKIAAMVSQHAALYHYVGR